MSKGKELGEFSLKTITITAIPGPGGSTMLQGNFEGTGTGVGTVILTATFVGRKSGTFSTTGVALADNGETVSTTGSGEFDSVGINRWRTVGALQRSDGQARVVEGEIDLASRSWKGKYFEKV